MGHAHHFLSRLDRLALAHVDLALDLYRDHDRLRYVLGEVPLPEGAERVAISLDDPWEGPFVVVTRAGQFVTCLAAGMHAGDLPIVTRSELDAITAKYFLWQEREAARDQLGGVDGGASFLFGRLLDAGPLLAREEFAALAALHPLIGDRYLLLSAEWALSSRKLQLKLKPVLKLLPKKKRGLTLRAEQAEQLQVYWQTFFASGHLAVLALADGGELVRQQAGGDEAAFGRIGHALAAAVIDGGIFSKTVRGSWALGQLGEAWIPHARRLLAAAKSGADVLTALLGLLAIGARHDALRAEVVSIFKDVPPLPNEESRSWANYVCECGVNVLADVGTIVANQRKMGAEIAVGARDRYPEGSPYRYRRPEDVPGDVAWSYPFIVTGDIARDEKMLPAALSMVVPAALSEPEQLYLPRRCVELIETKWEPSTSLEIMTGWLEGLWKPAPRPAGPTRSGPCPCGSGKKYKRCCGAAAT
jgi:SEC-C motif